jgi:L-amino acid N-acyltransferase YncA
MATVTQPVVDAWEYQTEKVKAVPYFPQLVPNAYPEEFLAGLYLQTKKDGLLRRAFPGASNFSLNWFVSYFYQRTMLVAVEKPDKILGYAWVYEVQGNEKYKKGSIGFVFFKEYWGSSLLREASQLGLTWMFQEMGLNILFATVATWNRASARFVKLLGFEHCGLVPSLFLNNDSGVDTHIFALRREDFFSRKGKS